MATVGQLYPTLADITKRTDPNGAIASVVESMQKVNPILQDMAWHEGNLPTGHRFTSRTALPSPTWRRFNQGIDPAKSESEQIDETCGMLEGLSKVDTGLVELNGNSAAFRADEDKTFLQGFNLELARALFYEDVRLNGERIHGLTPRLNALSSAQVINGANVTASDGQDENSIWLIGWSPDTVFGIYPKGSKAGITHEDLGKQLVRDAANKEFIAYVTHWKWNVGLCVKDSRYLVRIPNIDESKFQAVAAPAAGSNIPLAMTDAIGAMFEMNTVSPVFYMNRWTFSALNKQLQARTNNYLEWIDQGGRRIPSFLGVPIRVVDALIRAEQIVT